MYKYPKYYTVTSMGVLCYFLLPLVGAALTNVHAVCLLFLKLSCVVINVAYFIGQDNNRLTITYGQFYESSSKHVDLT